MKWYLRDTTEADWDAAEAATAALYRFAGISPPERFIRVRNPVTASQMGREIEPMGNMFFAPSWAPVAAVRERRGDCQPLVDLLLACGGVYPTKQVAILIDRPSVISLDSAGLLHSPDGHSPAIAWGRDPTTGLISDQDPEYLGLGYKHGKRLY